ncbi:uncharacterized protein F4812DRAFT_249945 [Daldinia caldariorum]|uniref:uncharacterized protein n=1 Tax=Daldinia caldariorum TaxID=326644 RepID=UPI00200737CB|nr:uncharacterized protein F4812DRAFT_249945 [Daldinia caldariorum]KAI1463282.1 hypothetical protein F4812DRAFT_249945 [Daldinia caldariorum]
MEPSNAIKRGEVVIPTPTWFIALRVLQIVLSLVAVALTGWWIHGLYYDELGFVIVCGIFTWVIAVYALLAEKVSSCRRAYNTWAILTLDGLMIIFWLAAMAATANRRSKFTIPVNASCVSDGSTINSGYCTVWKRADVASQGALGILSGIAGISALVMLLFVPTFAYVCHYFRLSFAGASANDPEKASPAAASVGVPGATELQAGIQQQEYAVNQQPNQQWTQQTVYPPQASQPQYQQGQVNDPYASHNAGYPGATDTYPQQTNQPEQPYNQPYSPQGTPAPYNMQGTPAPGQQFQPPYQSNIQ